MTQRPWRIPMQRRLYLCFVISLLWSVTGLSLSAQITTTTILGTVTDKSGAVIPNAQVTATNTATNLSRMVQSNSEGQYLIELLPVGAYQVEVSAAGFKKFARSGIQLDINRAARVDATLEVGTVSETVT